MGQNGDQGGRLFTEPCDLAVLQHCDQITSAVRELMRAYAMRPWQIKPFSLLDGAETVRILRAHGKLGFTSRQKAQTTHCANGDFGNESDIDFG